ncbi:MAG: hypothetical protein ACTSQ8_15055 [Candidatus Helarchaeota archaeon]
MKGGATPLGEAIWRDLDDDPPNFQMAIRRGPITLPDLGTLPTG